MALRNENDFFFYKTHANRKSVVKTKTKINYRINDESKHAISLLKQGKNITCVLLLRVHEVRGITEIKGKAVITCSNNDLERSCTFKKTWVGTLNFCEIL